MTFHAPEWVKDSVFYQIFPDRFSNGDWANDPPQVVAWSSKPERENFFGGDLKGILDKLPYLQNLGITALYLTPIFIARTNHRYDTCNYFLVDPLLGDIGLVKELVQEAHRRGIRLILDAVFNHSGDGFPKFQDLLKNGSASRYKDWFFPTEMPLILDPPNYQTCGGAAYLPKLNTMNPEVMEYLFKAAIFWLEECQIDGWRLDVPWKIPLDFWRNFRKAVKKVNPEAFIVGEEWRDSSSWLQGDTCDGIMNYPLRNLILDYCVYDTMDAEDFHLMSNRLYEESGWATHSQLNLLGSHDTPRLYSVCHEDIDRTVLALTALFTAPGAPMIYYGDEIGMTGGNDPDCRKSMIWEEDAWNRKILDAHTVLIHARQAHPALRRGSLEPLLILNDMYIFKRKLNDDEVIVILNPRENRRNLKIPLQSGKETWRDLYSNIHLHVSTDSIHIPYLSARTAMVLERVLEER